jgi:hypothetical protein
MTPDNLTQELRKVFPDPLPDDLVKHFTRLSIEVRTGVTERVSGGKFVETVVQCLQHLERGSFDSHPAVDSYLKNLESTAPSLLDDLRITLCRIGRACYTIRNKRNVAHKGDVDPNVYDLRFMFVGCQWVLSELLRHSAKLDKTTAGRLIDFVQIPANEIVESIGTNRTVHGDLNVEDEILLLLHSFYPDFAKRAEIGDSLRRRNATTVSTVLTRLYEEKWIHKEKTQFKLTAPGLRRALEIVKRIS